MGRAAVVLVLLFFLFVSAAVYYGYEYVRAQKQYGAYGKYVKIIIRGEPKLDTESPLDIIYKNSTLKRIYAQYGVEVHPLYKNMYIVGCSMNLSFVVSIEDEKGERYGYYFDSREAMYYTASATFSVDAKELVGSMKRVPENGTELLLRVYFFVSARVEVTAGRENVSTYVLSEFPVVWRGCGFEESGGEAEESGGEGEAENSSYEEWKRGVEDGRRDGWDDAMHKRPPKYTRSDVVPYNESMTPSEAYNAGYIYGYVEQYENYLIVHGDTSTEYSLLDANSDTGAVRQAFTNLFVSVVASIITGFINLLVFRRKTW